MVDHERSGFWAPRVDQKRFHVVGAAALTSEHQLQHKPPPSCECKGNVCSNNSHHCKQLGTRAPRGCTKTLATTPPHQSLQRDRQELVWSSKDNSVAALQPESCGSPLGEHTE
eukprot:6421147-Amphidinium_carterae.1